MIIDLGHTRCQYHLSLLHPPSECSTELQLINFGGVVPAHTEGPHPLHVPQSQLCRRKDFPNERNLPEEGCSDRSSPLDLSNSMSRSSSYSSIHQDGESVILSLLTSSRHCFWSISGQISYHIHKHVL